MTERVPYDEFSMFGDNAAEYGIPYAGPPAVRREKVLVSGGRSMSALVWGTGSPEVVFLHGGAQNAHTWDTVVLALGAHGHGLHAGEQEVRQARLHHGIKGLIPHADAAAARFGDVDVAIVVDEQIRGI